ncbi:helix-turn-helix transcriptional regulator [Catenulispora sp. NF23]|uniref:helix-turn-helix domain-containing protein n=1 Tax=Catenulispora pinistramenti TaxID=2705254 RepID=UPI001BAA888F|nr:helix-turn-helix transcriptional regulator [Catenulispora pinistramenti]MBS2538331.1 helix-turn-helix transcriptional regulator [Catenulispora pinistramenti]
MTNDILKTARLSLRLSQEELAKRLRDAGTAVGEPNDASKRLVQRWESGTTTRPRPVYARALETVLGMPIEAMGFPARVSPDTKGGHDMAAAADKTQGVAIPEPMPGVEGRPNYSGIWLSRYEFYSSNREQTFTGAHHVLLLQSGDRITGRSVSPSSLDSGSSLSIDLSIDHNVVTGTWREDTGSEGYYRGATYHGAVQLLVEPTGRRIAGKWVGFGKNFDVNTGPWELVFLDPSTAPNTVERYSQAPTE